MALAALAISPAAQAIDGFKNIGAGCFSPSASTLGISGDGRVVFGNGFVGYSRGWTYANGAYAGVPVLHPGYATIFGGVSYDGSVWAGTADGNPGLHMVRFEDGVLTDLHAGFVFGPGGQLDGYARSAAPSPAVRRRNGFSAGVTFEGELSNVTHSYASKGVVRNV